MMMQSISNYFISASRLTIIVVSLGLVFILGFIDYISGSEFSFSVFYTIPVFFTAWYCKRGYGVMISCIAAIVWLTADISAGRQYAHPVIPIWNSFIRLAFFIIITILLSIIKKKLDEEASLADTDSLTGLLNSRAFYEHIEAEAARAGRYGHPFTIIYIDLDNFKYVNDTQGHTAGDEALKTVADTLKKHLRQSDAIGRMGGDEFAGLFPETGYEAAESLMQNIVPVLHGSVQKRNWPITFSIGVITFMKPMTTPREMVRAADDLMYTVKKKGKNSSVHTQWGNR